MDITKASAKTGLDLQTDAALARVLGISRQALTRYDEGDPLAAGLQWKLRALHPDKFPLPPAANDDSAKAA
jgi:hypothetical protein